MRSYTVILIEPVDLESVASAAAEAFNLDRARIEIWDAAADIPAEPALPLAQVASAPGRGAYAEFVAFEDFAAHTGLPSHLDVARALAVRLGQCALFGPETAEEYRWTLVAGDGTHGEVVLDSDRLDEGAIAILGAVDHIPGAPHIARLPEPGAPG